jgi:peptidyl-prolyl cis-trans isomerase-like 2
MQAIDQLNIKTKSFKDLLTDEPYQRKDLITLQDPSNVDKFNLSNFYHLKHDLKLIDKGRQSIFNARDTKSKSGSILQRLRQTLTPG